MAVDRVVVERVPQDLLVALLADAKRSVASREQILFEEGVEFAQRRGRRFRRGFEVGLLIGDLREIAGQPFVA